MRRRLRVFVRGAVQGVGFRPFVFLLPSTPLHFLVHVLRDPTRGGVASALNEIATSAGVAMELDESSIPLSEEVRGACELLGFDPLYVANEGKCLAIVARERADEVLAAWRAHPLGAQAAILGEVREAPRGRVILRTRIGARRVVDMLSGEQLPRIC